MHVNAMEDTKERKPFLLAFKYFNAINKEIFSLNIR
jgi:hypothetical protein